MRRLRLGAAMAEIFSHLPSVEAITTSVLFKRDRVYFIA